MSSACADNHHHHHHYSYSDHPLFNLKQELNLPPRKLLTRHSNLPIPISEDFLNENPPTPKALSQRFLPYNADEDEDYENDDGDDELAHPYSTDDFRIYEFKVRRCMRSRSHDWTDCPFAHPGEKARRRDPRKFHYSGTSCADFRRGSCPRGDSCEFAHGVFECWLHPSRYRTQACKDGRSCRRKICFFAHTPKQLRILPSNLTSSCCNLCNSPTSTLMGFSHFSRSPPISPSMLSPPHSPTTKEELLLSYKKKLILDIVSSLEAMDLSGVGSSPSYSEDQMQTQFALSPCTPKAIAFEVKDYYVNGIGGDEMSNNGGSCPDLNWVNELLM